MNDAVGRDCRTLGLLGVAAAVCALGLWRFAPETDVALVRGLNEAASADLARKALRWLDRSGPAVLQIGGALVVAAALLFGRTVGVRRTAATWALGFVVAQAVVNTLKTVVRRERPLEADPASFVAILPVPDVARSFPSGHVTTSAAVAAGLWLLLGACGIRSRARHALILVPLAMLWDRVALALHHPSDALAGIAVAALSVAAVVGAGALISPVAGDAPAGRSFLPSRGALVACGVVAALLAAGFFAATPVVGRDAVTGEAVAGFTVKPRGLAAAAAEPFVGPALLWARVPGLRGVATTAAAVLGAAALVLLAFRRRAGARVALFLLVGLPAAWVGQFASGSRSPSKLVAPDKDGLFVDWHLHGGDRIDGRIVEDRMEKRQKSRGVGWAVTTRHDARPDEPRELAGEVFGAEWSGGDYPRSKTPHVLVLGDAGAVDAALRAKDALEAVRAGKAAGALAIVAHLWRTAAHVPGTPTPEEFVAAGADGFEVGNRYFDADPALRDAVRRIDALAREKKLLRISCSDDHGVPAGSGAVTWFATPGLGFERLGPLGVVRSLASDPIYRAKAAADAFRPLVFDDRDPATGGFAAAWPVRYVRALEPYARLAWLGWLFALLCGARRLAPARRDSVPQE